MARASSTGELLERVERLVWATEQIGEQDFVIPTVVARKLLDLARRVPQRGRPRLSGREHVTDWLIVQWVRERKAELVASGIKKEKAAEQAAEEGRRRALLKGRRLAASTIRKRAEENLRK